MWPGEVFCAFQRGREATLRLCAGMHPAAGGSSCTQCRVRLHAVRMRPSSVCKGPCRCRWLHPVNPHDATWPCGCPWPGVAVQVRPFILLQKCRVPTDRWATKWGLATHFMTLNFHTALLHLQWPGPMFQPPPPSKSLHTNPWSFQEHAFHTRHYSPCVLTTSCYNLVCLPSKLLNSTAHVRFQTSNLRQSLLLRLLDSQGFLQLRCSLLLLGKDVGFHTCAS